jgi:hypothetical protein
MQLITTLQNDYPKSFKDFSVWFHHQNYPVNITPDGNVLPDEFLVYPILKYLSIKGCIEEVDIKTACGCIFVCFDLIEKSFKN